MKDKRSGPMYFRPDTQNRDRLEDAAKLGFDMAPTVNDLIRDCWDSWFEKKRKERIQELQRSLSQKR